MTFSFFQTKSPKPSRVSLRRPAFRLAAIERLEDRLTPAATFTWIGAATGGSWDVPANWSLDSGTSTLNYPNAVGDIANLTKDFTGATVTVNLNVPITLSGLTISDTGAAGDSSIIIAAGTAGKFTFDNSGGGVTVANEGSAGTNAISANITLADNLSLNTTNSLALNGTIDETGGSRSITKSNAGAANSGIALGGLNTFSGGVVLNAGGGSGTLRINNGGTASASALGTGPLTINSGTIIDNTSGALVSIATGNAITVNGSFTFNGSNPLNLGSGTVTMTANISIGTAANTLTIDGIVQGNFNLTKSGAGAAGALILTNSGNTFGGAGKVITVTSGVLAVANNGALGDAGNTITFNGGGVGFSTPGSYTATTTSFGGHTINALGSNISRGYGAFDGVTLEITDAMTNVSGTNGLAVYGAGSGKVLSLQTNTFNGAVVINSGTFQANNPANLGNNASLTLAGGTLALRNDSDINFNKNLTVTASSTIDINQDTGAGSNRTITLGTVSIATFNLTVNGGNGYSLATGNISVNNAGSDPTLTSNISNWAIASTTAPSNGGGSNTIVTFAGTGTATVTGSIGVAAGLLSVVKNGAGTLFLQGASPTLNNGVTLNLGTLATINNPNAFGSGTITLESGTLSLQFDGTGNDGVIAGPSNAISLTGPSTIDVSRSSGGVFTGNTIQLGVLGGVSSTNGTANTTLAITGSNGYKVQVGTLRIGSSIGTTLNTATDLIVDSMTSASGQNTPNLVKSGNATMTVGGIAFAANVTGLTTNVAAGVLEITGTATTAAAATNFTKTGSGVLRLRNLTYSMPGTTALSAGTLQLRYDGAGSNQNITVFPNAVTAGNGVTIDVDRASSSNTGNTLVVGSFTSSPATMNITGSNGYKLGFTTLTLAFTSTIFTINNTTADVVVGTLTNTGNNGGMSKSGAGALTIAATALSGTPLLNLALNDGVTEFTTGIDQTSGTVAVEKGGAGILRIPSASNFAGGFELTSGPLELGDNAALSTAGFKFTGGTVSAVGGSRTFNNIVTFNSVTGMIFGGSNDIEFTAKMTTAANDRQVDVTNTGLTTFSGQFFISESGTGRTTIFNVAANSILAISGQITQSTGASGINKAGPGLLIISGTTNNYTNPTIVSGGVLRLTSANAIPGGLGNVGGTSGVTLNGGVLELASVDFQRNLGTSAAQFQFAVGTGSGGFSAFGADRTVSINNANASLVWGNNNLTGTLLLSSPLANAKLVFDSPIDLKAGVATTNRTIQVDNGSAAIDASITRVIGSSTNNANAVLNKTGAGTLELTQANTYGGGTAIAAGTLLASNSNGSATGTGPVNVNTGGSLGGTGSVGGAVAVNGGGTLTPGNGVGVIAVNNASLTFIPSGNYNWQINNATHTSPTPGVDYDTVNVTGTGTLDLSNLSTSNRFNINLWSLTSGNVNGNSPNWDNSQAHTWTLVATANAIVLPGGGFDNNDFNVNIASVNGTGGFTNPLNGIFTVALSLDGTDLLLNYYPVTATTYTLGASAAAPNIRAATGSSTITTTITNTGTTGAHSDTIAYTSLGSTASMPGGTLTSGAGGGSVAANAAGTANATATQTFSNATAGSYVFTPSGGTVSSPYSTPTLSGAPGTATIGVYDLAQPQYTGGTLNFGNIHAGATVSNQNVAFTNPALTNASFQDSLNVSATTNNARVTATGFTGLLANGAAQNLSIAINTTTIGTLNSSLTLTLVSNANGVNGLSNTTLTPGAAIGTTGQIYSGVGVWNTNGGGNWNDFSRWTANGGAPGLDAEFTTTDSASFGDALTSAPAVIFLNNSNPSINALSFDNPTRSYNISANAGDTGALTLRNGGQAASLTVASGSHAIGTPIHLLSNLNATVAGAADTLTLSGALDGNATFTKNGSGTLILSGVNTYTGDTVVTAGRLVVNTPAALGSGTGAGRVTIQSGAVLSGSGKIGGPVDVEEGGIFAPGNSPGTIGTGSLSLKSNSTLNEEIENAGSYDIIDVTGTVNLNANAKLRVFLDVGYTPTPGQQFTIINNDDVDAISGLFKDYTSPNAVLNEGDTFSAGGNLFRISYVGGTGNDIVLTCVNPSVTALTPMIGPTIGGTIVIITGVNFSGTTFADATSVTFGGIAATTYTVNSSSQITATAPAGASTVNVAVTRGGVTSDINGSGDNYTYSAPSVASAVVNGGPNVTLSSTGSVVSLGSQHSVVRQILVTFNQAVTVASDAFTVTPRTTNVTVNGGASPSTAAATTSVTMISASTYLVTFVNDGIGAGPGGVLKSGVYDLTTIASKVSAGGETMTANATTTFFAMFGTIDANNSYTMGTTGDGASNAFVDPGSLFQFSDAFGSTSLTPAGPPAYNIVFDANLDGFVDPGDLFAFSDSFGIDWDF